MTTAGDGQVRSIQIPVEQFRSVPITMYFLGGRPLDGLASEELDAIPAAGTGSAFFYRLDGKLFLLTARHCFSARHWETGEFLPGSHNVEPTHLELWIRERPPGGKWNMLEPAPIRRVLLPLLGEDGQPIWLEHPLAGAGVDVAVLPIPAKIAEDDTLMIEAYSQISVDGEAPRIEAAVAKDVFIVGYPYGLQSGFMLPLWIRGTIASEPAMYYNHIQLLTQREQALPVLIVDARTREGQSGSPAILYQGPLTPIITNNGEIRLTVGGVSRLLGVYSGRTSVESDLGFVWRMEEVDVICRGGKRARLDHKWPLPPFPPA